MNNRRLKLNMSALFVGMAFILRSFYKFFGEQKMLLQAKVE